MTECPRLLYYPLLIFYLLFFASQYFLWYSFNFCIFSSDIWYLFFPYSVFLLYVLQIIFNIYLLLAFLIFHYYFYNIVFLYLVLHFCFFDSRLYYSFLYATKKKIFLYKIPFLSIKLELVIKLFCITLTHVQKINSVYTFFNMNNSNIFKIIRFLHYIITTITKIWPIILLISIPSEISILSYSNIYIDSYKQSSK